MSNLKAAAQALVGQGIVLEEGILTCRVLVEELLELGVRGEAGIGGQPDELSVFLLVRCLPYLND